MSQFIYLIAVNLITSVYKIALLAYFKKMKVGLSYHQPVCVCMCICVCLCLPTSNFRTDR
jgi:hypothetical protein